MDRRRKCEAIVQTFLPHLADSSRSQPFRALDEFSVFLDPANDAVAQESLVNHGLEVGPQFIILTPLQLRLSDELRKKIKVIQLKKQ